jgi:hypothetical protein
VLAVFLSPPIRFYAAGGGGEILFALFGVAAVCFLLHWWETDQLRSLSYLALALMLTKVGLKVAQDGVAITVCGATRDDLAECVGQLKSSGPPDPVELAEYSPIKEFEKYHWCLSEDLLDKDYARAILDVDRAWLALQSIASLNTTDEKRPVTTSDE